MPHRTAPHVIEVHIGQYCVYFYLMTITTVYSPVFWITKV